MKLSVASVLFSIALLGCDTAQKDAIALANEGSKLYAGKQWDAAIEKYKRAVEKWPDHHGAHYGLAGAYSKKGNFELAAEHAAKAAKAAPHHAMYHQFNGQMQYQKVVEEARKKLAEKEQKKIEEVTPDLTNAPFEPALAALNQAIKQNPLLWKAHYYIGVIQREKGNAKEAAQAFTNAVKETPTDPQPYVALAEIYRQWDYTDQAIQVASEATKVVPGDTEKSDLWYLVGLGYDDKGNHKQAIEAYDKAVESRRDNYKAKFQRGQAYYKLDVFDKAKRDLEEFSKSGGASVEFAKQQASYYLMMISAKTATGTTPAGAPSEKMSPEDMVKKSKESKGG